MSWVKLDDRFFDNPKIAALSDGAQLAYLKSVAYCARELTDGFVAKRKAEEYARPKIVKELSGGLWEPCAGGFMVHDYLKYNPTREKALAEREAAKRRMFGLRSSGSSEDVRANIEGTSGRTSDAPVKPIPLPIPDKPVEPEIPYHDPVPLPTRAVVVGFERAFGRLLSPTELELVKVLEDEQPKERIEFALTEAAALNKRSVRYVQRTCERIANDNGSSPSISESDAGANPGRMANRVSGLGGRRAAVAERGRKRET